jgi:hypothetical protein
MKHGTSTGYQRHGCRCDGCRAAAGAQVREARKGMRERGAENPALIPHGTSTGYSTWGCRCWRCSNAADETKIRWLEKRIIQRIQEAS